jgi:hypothetical protein
VAWLRVDDGFPEHAKLLALRRTDRWTWVEVLAYCARQNNGGVVPNGVHDVVKYATPLFLEKCADAGLLDVTDSGYVVHDWEDYNPRDPTNAVRQQRYRRRHSNAQVTENVTEENVTTVTPRARASRPVPITTTPSNPSTSTTDGKEGRIENGEHTLPDLESILNKVDAA